MEELIQFDKQLLLAVNGSDSVFLDYVVLMLTNAKTWIPLYLGLFYVLVKTYGRNYREILFVMLAAGLCVLLAGTVDDSIVKPLVARWRPTHDPEIGAWVTLSTAIVAATTVSSLPMLPIRSASPCSSRC